MGVIEKFQIPEAVNPSQQGDSPIANNCSVPKSNENNTENSAHENESDEAYAERRQKCIHDIETMAGKVLQLTYPKEYKTWSNSKNRSKRLKQITGPNWGLELDTFPGFLRQVGPKRYLDGSLDRIDPSHGYVVGNVRWASKQLQSENRKNVEIMMVRGVPMTKPQLAAFLGISYDALRMRLYRGETAEDIIAGFLRAEKPTAKNIAAKIEACPWPEGRERDWEAAFQVERHNSYLELKDENSRTEFFVAKCRSMVTEIDDWGHQYADRQGPDSPMPAKWIWNREYRIRLLHFALEKRELVLKEQAPPQYELDASEEELATIEMILGEPSPISDEEVGRDD